MDNETIVRNISILHTDVENLKGWQKAQNGSIHEIREDVSKMKYWIMGATLGVALNLLGITATAIFLYLKVVQ